MSYDFCVSLEMAIERHFFFCVYVCLYTQWRTKMLGFGVGGQLHADSDQRSHSCFSISIFFCGVSPTPSRFLYVTMRKYARHIMVLI